MSQATLPVPRTHDDAVPERISGQLRSLRRSVNLWLAVRGLSRLLLVVAGIIALDALIDWNFRMDVVQRGICLVLMGGLTVFVIYRFLIRPLSHMIDDDTLCQRVESQNQELGQSLISAVQFSRMSGFSALGVSETMVAATIEEGKKRSQTVQFDQILNDSAFWRNLLLGVIVLLVGGTALAARPNLTQIWLNRNILLGNERWPQKTYLVVQGVENGTLILPKGDDWLLVVSAQEDKEIPDVVYLESRPMKREGLWRTKTTASMNKKGENNFELTFKNVLEPFEFRVYGGDDRTPWYSVVLVTRPSVDEMSLTLIPPKYISDSGRKLPPGKGPYYAYRGSELEIVGEANKSLRNAYIVVGEERFDATVSGNNFHTRIPADKLKSGSYAVHLRDNEPPAGLESKRPYRFELKVRRDLPPVVRADLVGISSMIVPGARVPIACRLQDEFAVTSADIVYFVEQDTDEPAPKVKAGEEPKPTGRQTISGADVRLNKKEIKTQYPWEIGPLKLEPGQWLKFHVAAGDNDSLNGPNIGKSNRFSLRIVTADELHEDLLRRAKFHSQDFQRIVDDQQSMHDACEDLLAETRGRGSLPDKQRLKVINLQRRQALVSDRCRLIAVQLRRLVEEARNNRLEEPGGALEKKMLDQIVKPIESLAKRGEENSLGGEIEQAALSLDRVRRLASRQEDRNQSLSGTITLQKEILRQMKLILAQMALAGRYQEAINEFRKIVREEEGLRKDTIKASERAILEQGEESKKKKDPDEQPKSKTEPKKPLEPAGVE